MGSPEFETQTGAKIIFGSDGTDEHVVKVDSDGHIQIDTLSDADPTSKYKITDIDPTAGNQYFGYTDKDNNWYIMHLTTTQARYIKGDSGYTTAWTGRAGLSYDYFYNIF